MDTRKAAQKLWNGLAPVMDEAVEKAGVSGDAATAVRILIIEESCKKACRQLPRKKAKVMKEVAEICIRMVMCGATYGTRIA